MFNHIPCKHRNWTRSTQFTCRVSGGWNLSEQQSYLKRNVDQNRTTNYSSKMTHTDVMLTRHETPGGFFCIIASASALWIDGVAVWNHAILMLCKRHIKRKAIETGGFQRSRQPGQTCPPTMPAFLSCSRGFCGLWVGRADHPSSESPQNAFWWRESFLNCLWSEIFRGRGVALIHCIYHCFTHMVLVYWQWNNQVQFVHI